MYSHSLSQAGLQQYSICLRNNNLKFQNTWNLNIDRLLFHFPNETERITRYVNAADFIGVEKWQMICF